LRRFRFPAVVFVATGSIGERRFPRDEKYPAQGTKLADELLPMTWEEIGGIADLVAVGGHSVTHGRLGQLSAQRVEWEVQECRRQIEARGIGPVTSFAYPDGIRYHGDYNALTRQALMAAGYRVAFNSEIGRNGVGDDPYCQRRIEPRQADTRRLFEAKLMGGYDWVGGAQAAFHRVFAPDAGK
jgi:peptidoglycan/xylan/chitin deacetylase (PgdA/CDA1 family)